MVEKENKNRTKKHVLSKENNNLNNFKAMSDLTTEVINQIYEARNNENGVIGVPSEFTEIDKITSGWQPADFIIIAARPAMGKTAYALSLARNAAVDFKVPVAYFSLEMYAKEPVTRLISFESGIYSEKLRRGMLNNEEMHQVQSSITSLAEAPLFIDDTANLSVSELRDKVLQLKINHDLQLLIIDYLQLMQLDNESEIEAGTKEQEISIICRSLKSLAKELNIPIIALSQLSNSVEKRGGDYRPLLSDLNEMGNIVQHADMVQFICRPSYYGITKDEEGNSTEGIANIIISKHRNGPLRDIRLRYIDTLSKFEDFDYGDFN